MQHARATGGDGGRLIIGECGQQLCLRRQVRISLKDASDVAIEIDCAGVERGGDDRCRVI